MHWHTFFVLPLKIEGSFLLVSIGVSHALKVIQQYKDQLWGKKLTQNCFHNKKIGGKQFLSGIKKSDLKFD